MNKFSHNNTNPTISVIMTLYNVSSYIKKSLTSVMNQTFKDIEILIIDDCGNDDSLERVKKFKKYDSRIKIIQNEKNLGPGKSKNIGIKAAKGEYVFFIDGDDYLNLQTLEKLYLKAVKIDVDYIGYNHIKIWENSDKIVYHHFEKFEDKYFQTMGPITKLYKKEFLLKNNIFFDTFRHSEDMSFAFQVYMFAKKYTWLDFDGYYYIQHSNSFCYQQNKKEDKRNSLGIIKALKKIDILLEQNVKNKNFNFLLHKLQFIKLNYLYTSYRRRHPENLTFFLGHVKKYLSDFPEIYEKFLQKIYNPTILNYSKILEKELRKDSKKKFILYGFNDLAIKLHEIFYKDISAIIDKNKQGEIFQNHIIQNLEKISTYQKEIFVITAINDTYIKDIKKSIVYRFPKAKIIHLHNSSTDL
ncbi:glycosyltransferase family 2 protein [Arcobacter sp.]|uniref:glycosyltransferase family 2 protein n=1 Tax=unclassified Arcobacter TaxID=2593671 RepID=UPI003B002089